MLKISLLRRALFFFSLSFINLLHATPDTAKSDPLQLYRDEIKQAETNASQAVLDQLKPSFDENTDTRPSVNSQPETPMPPRSNSDKAFAAPSPDKRNNNTANPPSTNTNPWLKPNPWAEVKKNPWANVPIPGPSSPPTDSTRPMIPSPPNIFAPPQQSNYKMPPNARP